MAPLTWSPPHHRVIFSPSLHASVSTHSQEIVPPSHHHTLPPGTQSNRATCHTHAATVLLWDLVRHLVRHCDTTVPSGAPPWNHLTTVPPGAPPCHLFRHHATWSATVPPCCRRTDTTHRHTSVHQRTWQSIIPLYRQTLSDAISPYSLLLK